MQSRSGPRDASREMRRNTSETIDHKLSGMNGHEYPPVDGGYATTSGDSESAWLSRPTQTPRDLFNFSNWPKDAVQPIVSYPSSKEGSGHQEDIRTADFGGSVVISTGAGASVTRTSKHVIAPFIVADRMAQPEHQQYYHGSNNGMHMR